MTTTKNWMINLYFHYKEGDDESKEKAQMRRYESAVYLKKLFEKRSRFSVIARDENKTNKCLLLRGYVNLHNGCKFKHIKNLIGKHSNAKPAGFGDVVMLMKYWTIDKQVVVTGRLPSQGNNGSKRMQPYATDARWILKTLSEEMKKPDFDSDKVNQNADVS